MNRQQFFGELALSAEYGSIHLENVSCSDVLSAVSNSAGISLQNVSAKNGFDIKSQYGDCRFEELSGKSLAADLYNGSTDIRETALKDNIRIVSEYGSIGLRPAHDIVQQLPGRRRQRRCLGKRLRFRTPGRRSPNPQYRRKQQLSDLRQ